MTDTVNVFSDFDTREASKEGVRMPLLNPADMTVIMSQGPNDDQPQENYLVIKGTDSPETRRAFEAIQNRVSQDDGPKKTTSDADYAQENKKACMALAKLTVGGKVYGNTDHESTEFDWVEITKENAYSVYAAAPAFRDQAIKFVMTRGNFLKS